MRRKVVLSPTARESLEDLLDYLEIKWSEKVKDEFIKKLDRSIEKIALYPKSCPESAKVKGLYKCVVTKQTSLFYQIEEKEIQVVTVFDTRQDPDKLKP